MDIFDFDEKGTSELGARLRAKLDETEPVTFPMFADWLSATMKETLPDGQWHEARALVAITLCKAYALALAHPFFTITKESPPAVIWPEQTPKYWFTMLKRLELAYSVESVIRTLPPIVPN